MKHDCFTPNESCCSTSDTGHVFVPSALQHQSAATVSPLYVYTNRRALWESKAGFNYVSKVL